MTNVAHLADVCFSRVAVTQAPRPHLVRRRVLGLFMSTRYGIALFGDDTPQLLHKPCVHRVIGVAHVSDCVKLICATFDWQGSVGNFEPAFIALGDSLWHRDYKVGVFHN